MGKASAPPTGLSFTLGILGAVLVGVWPPRDGTPLCGLELGLAS